ncbi:UDP-N-acetylmuramate--L-alanine ligase [Pontibacter qinzhouensis]|uniref:UDP-N-acetylmuramate--L-alanine ligase n=1 Tax=Pontibacter qinzhouensis TaxID=2603253 RepID=A0A5C8K1P5_9BACT|nr:UDP-N-acetylmuramate--L-alanine ligase [Pontibacter qinzhouensis]TXK44475.1 UDP-N-acetylmuramate--L-alanine ligase [Pontibacter qinzhouensis]
MKLETFKYIYFLGIGGIGMSAIARWFHAKGFPVWGYDKTRTPLSEALEQEGIVVHYTDDVKELPEEVLQHKEETLVVLTPAIPADHAEWAFFREQHYTIQKRSQVLGIITASAYTIAVAGTHGKTTTSSIVAHLLHSAGVDCSAFLGGIATNLNSNLLIGSGTAGNEVVVVEADEFDRSFLTLFPDIAIVTSADPDHLDIYGDKDELVRTFQKFIGQIKPGGTLIIHDSIQESLAESVQPGVQVIKYGLHSGEARIKDLTIEGRWFKFNALTPLGAVARLELGLPGFHNVENTLAALVATQLLQIEEDKIREGVKSYKGVKRRFEFVYEGEGKTYVDDYAHHPREIEAFLTSLRALFPDKKLKVIFQPHLYSRTRDFASGFSESLSLADELVLLDIYPAREQPIPGITSDIILSGALCKKKSILSKEDVLHNFLENLDFDVLATVGAGDIDTLVLPLKNLFKNRRDGLE